MNKQIKVSLATLTLVFGFMLLSSSLYAYNGEGNKQGLGKNIGDKFKLIPEELHNQIKQQHQNLSAEEKEQLRSERKQTRDARRAEMEEFTGISREEMKQAHLQGKNMGDVLSENGVSYDEAQAFLTQKANEKVNDIATRHSLSESQLNSVKVRVNDFVNSILTRWFGN